MVTMATSPSHPSNKQARMREKAEEINLVLLEPDVDLWKLRELALSEGGLVNDTIRRRAWPKLVGLTSNRTNKLDDISERKVLSDIQERKMISVLSPARKKSPKVLRRGPTPELVTNFGKDDNNNPGTAFTGGPFDQHDTTATAALAEDDTTSLASFDDSVLSSHVVACMDAEQIERDVTRCTWHLLTGGQRSRRRIIMNKHRKKISKILRRKQRRLGDLINLTLAVSEEDLPTEDRLCYYQGYHDVASIFLAALGGASIKAIEKQQQQTSPGSDAAVQAATMGLEMSSKVLYQVSLSHFREPMRKDFLHLQTALRMVLLPLLSVMDPEVHAHLYGCGMEPFFALSWMLTWFSHDIRDTTLVKRLFDFFLCSHPLMPIYLSVAMLCHSSNRQEILATPCEFAELHSVLAGLPKNSSMVGWKYRVGDGYVSDDDEIGEDGETSISLDSDMQSNGNSTNRTPGGSHSLNSGYMAMMRREDLILSEGHAHVVSMGIPAHVPFQELIDTAIKFMRRIPPRKLRGLAMRYFGPMQGEPMMAMYPGITLFQPPPSWALVARAKADWVLKQRGRTPTREPRRRYVTTTRKKEEDDSNNDENKTNHEAADQSEKVTPEMIEKLAKKLKWPKAMVAQGFGPGEEEVVRERKRRRLLMIGGAATVAVLVIAVGVARSRNSRLKGSSGGGDFFLTREDAVSYVKSTGSARGKNHHQSDNSTDWCLVPSNATSAPTLSVISSNESLLRRHVQRILVGQFRQVYAKVQLVVKTVEFLKSSVRDPEFHANIQKALSESFAKVGRTLTDSQGRANVRNGAVRASQNVGRSAVNALKNIFLVARDHLGGDQLEELELGA
ncbi:TBC1 domain family member 20 [Seminavis robusta]|uniref:TBC1 domain family member 20 n=1 Tax=Seminavis robusta TaxID=568900 RepID=A0A9N8EB05_9STRA|nr:TBC1 domain family member 20 [Seminavis robusta]|eukprot:Sro693_g188330.1 TBC1 domain family member 20 (843) ;mRNA; f:32391-34999